MACGTKNAKEQLQEVQEVIDAFARAGNERLLSVGIVHIYFVFYSWLVHIYIYHVHCGRLGGNVLGSEGIVLTLKGVWHYSHPRLLDFCARELR